MKYLWTEDTGAGLHFWQMVNQYLFDNGLIVESKAGNQGLLDAVRALQPSEKDTYYIAFDIVYDNMDIVNKLLELQELIQKHPKQIVLLDMTCFEAVIFSFKLLIEWTGTGRKDKIEIREHILRAFSEHRIEIDKIEDRKTLDYMMRFKRFSTEKVLKAITYELTDGDAWSVKGEFMGECWHKDCCVLDRPQKAHCNLTCMSGREKIMTLLGDTETQRLIKKIAE